MSRRLVGPASMSVSTAATAGANRTRPETVPASASAPRVGSQAVRSATTCRPAHGSGVSKPTLTGAIPRAPCDASNCTTCEFKNTWIGTFRGRIGYALDRWLPYITGDAAYGGLKMSAHGVSVTKTNLGRTLGGGVECAFMGAWSAKLEYLYADLGSMTCAAAT